MIVIGEIEKIKEQRENFDEIWWIVHSPDSEPESEKERVVPLLAPSHALFRKYREAYHRGMFDQTFFDQVYVPRFIQELSENKEAKRLLLQLCGMSRWKNIALCCYCQEESTCHRSIIAGILLGMGAEIQCKSEYLQYIERYRSCVENTAAGNGEKKEEMYEELLSIYVKIVEDYDLGELESSENFVKTQEYSDTVWALETLSGRENPDKDEKNMLIFGMAILDFYRLIDVFDAMDKTKAVQSIYEAYLNGER